MDLYRVHVSLREIEPAIWRRIEISSQTTLKQLHRILQIAMGWENYHLHEYIVDGRRYGTPEPDYDEPGEVVREVGVRLACVDGAWFGDTLHLRFRLLLAARCAAGSNLAA